MTELITGDLICSCSAPRSYSRTLLEALRDLFDNELILRLKQAPPCLTQLSSDWPFTIQLHERQVGGASDHHRH